MRATTVLLQSTRSRSILLLFITETFPRTTISEWVWRTRDHFTFEWEDLRCGGLRFFFLRKFLLHVQTWRWKFLLLLSLFIRKVTMSDILCVSRNRNHTRLIFVVAVRLVGWFTWIPSVCCYYSNNFIFINSNSVFEHAAPARTHPNIDLSIIFNASNLFCTCMISCSNAVSLWILYRLCSWVWRIGTKTNYTRSKYEHQIC